MIFEYVQISVRISPCPVRDWSKSKGGGGGGPEENRGWVNKFRALQRGGSSYFSAGGGGVGRDSF